MAKEPQWSQEKGLSAIPKFSRLASATMGVGEMVLKNAAAGTDDCIESTKAWNIPSAPTFHRMHHSSVASAH